MLRRFRIRLRYWLQLHTMNPLTWWWVILESAHHKLENAIHSPKKIEEAVLLDTEDGCPFCGSSFFTEQGLCEKCGNAVLYF